MGTFYGDDDHDDYYGTSGDDIVFGYGGNDYLRGGAGNDILYGGEGSDILRGGSGVDRFYGGAGFDRVSFFDDATQGVVVDLRRQLILNDGFGNRETMSSIEGLGGSTRFRDIFHGDDGRNYLIGNQGDRLFGHGGDDIFRIDGIVDTVIDGGDGRDVLELIGFQTTFNDVGVSGEIAATDRVVIDLSRGLIVNDGFGGTGRIRNIEDLVASAETGSRLTGSDASNSLAGHIGEDRLMGLGGDDILSGSEGNDQLFGGDGNDVLIGGVGRDQLTGGEGSDTFAFSGFNTFGGYYDAEGQFVGPLMPGDSGATQKDADRIFDFSSAEGDIIDLFGIDAIAEPGGIDERDNAFTWIGTNAFSGAGGEARYVIRNGNTFVQLDIGGEAGGAMVIRLDGEHVLTAADFVL